MPVTGVDSGQECLFLSVRDPCPLCQVIASRFSIGESVLSPTVCSPGGTANQRRLGTLKNHTWMGNGGSWVVPSGGFLKILHRDSQKLPWLLSFLGPLIQLFLHHVALATVSVPCNQRTLVENTPGIRQRTIQILGAPERPWGWRHKCKGKSCW